LNPQAGQRQTACILNISAPQRSHNIFSCEGWGVEGGGDEGFGG
jgi:hypothetical protein